MTDAEKIELLRAKLQETVDENDQLRAELARRTEGAKARDTLSEQHRNPNLSASDRRRAAQALLPYEESPLQSVPPAVDATCEEIIPLAELVTLRRAHVDRMNAEARQIRVLPSGQVVVLDEGNGGNGSDD